jgi:uncharacterized protein (TIGR00369 family)
MTDTIPTEAVGFDAHYGLQIDALSDTEVRAHVDVGPQHLQPFGLVHGGVFAAIAETLASFGTWIGVKDEGNVAMGQSNATSFLRPITEGTIHAVATRFHRGRTTWLWDVEIRDDAGRLCAATRMTIAVRPMAA